MTFRIKIMLLFTLLTLVPVAAVSLLFFQQSQKVLRQTTAHHLATTNEAKIQSLEQWIGINTTTLSAIANQPVLGHTLPMILGDHGSSDQIRKGLLPFVRDDLFMELFLVDTQDGHIMISTDTLQEDKYMDDQLFFDHGRKGPFVQDITFDLAAQAPTMIFSIPLRDKDGRLFSLLAAKANLASLSRLIEKRNTLSRTEDSYLVNKFNYFITAPRFGSHLALKGTLYNEGIKVAGKTGRFMGVHEDYRGIPVMGETRWLPERQLFIITEIDVQEAYAPIQRLKKMLLLIASLICSVAALLGWVLSDQVTRPLLDLMAAVQRVKEDDLDFKPVSGLTGEFAALSSAFARMTERLNHTMVSKKHLEQEITVRKAAEAKANQMVSQLQQSNEDLQQFAYVASHDLQEPLRMVASFTQLLSERYKDALDDKAQRWIAFAVDGANRMQKLIQDLLSFSRVSTHGREFTPTDLNQVMENVIQNLSTSISETAATISCDALPSVRADESQLTMLLQNLVSNALKFCRADQPRIHVAAEKKGREQIISVADNGIGISREFMDKIFVIFQRLHTQEEFPGTGLGLAVCKRIVQRHQGRIWVASEQGKGSVFYFSLPD